MPVYIDIVPQPNSSSTGSRLFTAPPASASDSYPLGAARHIRNIDPTVTFVSPSLVNGKSSYIVLLDGAPVHSEDTMLQHIGPYFDPSTGRSSGDEPALYNTALVPKYWDVLCEAADPTMYTIVQDVYCVPDPVPKQDYAQRPRPVRIFSAIYHFQYQSSADAAPSYGQPPVNVPRSGSSMTSAFNERTLQGSMAMGPTQTSFPMPTTYAVPTSESLRTPTELEQNLFDEPFMLDVSINDFEQMAFDDLVASLDKPDAFFM
jgi:hypothetical protein